MKINRPTEKQINSAIAALCLTLMDERKWLYFNQDQYDDETQAVMQQRINDKVYMIDFLRELLLVPQYFELTLADVKYCPRCGKRLE